MVYADRVLILTTFDLDEYVYAVLRAGASGFLLKDTPRAGLLAAIRVIATGDAQLAPAITRRLIAEFARRPEPGRQPAATLEGVTEREREVLNPDRPGAARRRDRVPSSCTMLRSFIHLPMKTSSRLTSGLGSARPGGLCR